MSKPAILRDRLMALLPPRSARKWILPREIVLRHPELRSVLHPALLYMVRMGYAIRRRDKRSGLYEYARKRKPKRPGT